MFHTFSSNLKLKQSFLYKQTNVLIDKTKVNNFHIKCLKVTIHSKKTELVLLGLYACPTLFWSDTKIKPLSYLHIARRPNNLQNISLL